MPPKPVDDLPAVGDDLLRLLLALWKLVYDLCFAFRSLLLQVLLALWSCFEVLWTILRDLCVVLWDCTSQVLWTLWTGVEALWTMICDVCVFVWDSVSQAVSTVWTYFLETFWNEFVGAMIGLTNYVVAHPATATVMFVLAFVFIPRALSALGTSFSQCLDDEGRSALRDSYAANYQSTSYGGNVPRESAPARSQSQDTKGGYRVVSGSLRYSS